MKEHDNPALAALQSFVRYRTHGGYTWAAVAPDGDLLCEQCAKDNYAQIWRATRDNLRDGWAIQGLTNSGESEDNEICCQCNKDLWTHWRPADVILYLSDARGVYIPQNFAEQTKRECVSGVDQGDWDILLAGPDHEAYWEVWDDVIYRAVVTSPDTGKQYTLWQDGDLWLLEKGAEWEWEDRDEGLDSARIRI